ncbi:MAG: amino acid ABC transporter permease, partial [Deltaproteobacteria bacterium]|nr:amino acid ABC transporter permease [Deltaproteobacteria bacterium]
MSPRQCEHIPPYTASKPPKSERGVLLWLRYNLFSPWYNSLLTIFTTVLLYLAVSPLWRWGIQTATFGTSPESCRGSEGACWGFIADMWPIFLVGTYPFEQRWRVLVAFGVLLTLIGATLIPKLRRWKPFYLLWALSPLVIFAIIRGGELVRLQYVPSTQWGGLMLTVILSAVSMCCAF